MDRADALRPLPLLAALLAALWLLPGCPGSSPPTLTDALVPGDLPGDAEPDAWPDALPDARPDAGPCRVREDCPEGLVCANGACQEGLACAEALQTMMSMNVPPDQAAAGVSQWVTGAAAEAFAALLECAQEACGPLPDWVGYGCAVPVAFQGDCLDLYRACVDCQPSCQGLQCGDDGCGGSCGTCPGGQDCRDGRCEGGCVPECAGRACGSDGCGGTCGFCGPDAWCDGAACVPFRSCADLFACWSGCDAVDQGCIDACWAAAAPEARAQYQDLVDCLVDACGPDATDTCYAQAYYGACRAPYQACLECTPNCTGRQCGDDGCGGACGTCPGGGACGEGGICRCVPQCTGLQCGPDGCGGSCGTCGPGQACSAAGRCVASCTPSCVTASGEKKQCGGDGCGGSCGTCPPGASCSAAGRCVTSCTPSCVTASGEKKQCGGDGCGGTCGTCPAGYACSAAGRCVTSCTPSCVTASGEKKQCGGDGCGGTCGTCPSGYACKEFRCVSTCTPSCITPDGQRKQCGDDGCGGSCGSCAPGLACLDGTCSKGLDCYDLMMCMSGCDASDDACYEACYRDATDEARQLYLDIYYCVADLCPQMDDACTTKALQGPCRGLYQQCMSCTPSCAGKACGDDGCGGSCGTCPSGTACDGRSCVPSCVPSCRTPDGQRRQCGDDGCGGQCGFCPADAWCDGSFCVPWCTPRCENRQCGDDGCGGQCGWCPEGFACSDDGFCVPGGSGGCVARDIPGCDGCACQDCVCARDPYCCQTAWDDVCAQECAQCGGCGGCVPSCTTPWGTPMQCGDDGCGGSCGACPLGTACDPNTYTCTVVSSRTCGQMIECAYGCPGFDPACVQQCMSGGSSASQQRFWDLANCVMQACGLPPDDACLQEAMASRCASQYKSCRLDGQVYPM